MVRRTSVFGFGLLAAIAYCSWPLGYLVNRGTASSALASDLELSGQPFAWLFVLLDCACGLAVLLVVGLAWRDSGLSGGHRLQAGLVAYGAFGFATSFDALLPEHCGSVGLAGCGADLARPNLDDLLTGVAFFALFVASGMIVAVRSQGFRGGGLGGLIARGVFLGWSICGLVFLGVHFSERPAIGLQHAMLTLTSGLVVCLACLLATSVDSSSLGRGSFEPPRVS